MLENVKIRLLIILGVIALFSYLTFPLTNIPLGLDLRGGVHIEAEIDMDDLARKFGKQAISVDDKAVHLDQAIVVIRERINQSGLIEAEVRKGGNERITLQIPGYADKSAAENLLTQVGYLEFALVSEDQPKINLAIKGKRIPGYRLLKLISGRQGESFSQNLLIKEKPEFDGTHLKSSTVSFSQNFNEPQVTLTFTSKGTKLFASVTRKSIGRRLAIILDDNIVSAPVIQTEISGGNAVISGKFTLDEAKQLSMILNAGALPAKIKILESRVVSATLGKDSIDQGTKAAIFGLIFVAIFMMLYYLKAGFIAVIALMMNILCILGAVSFLKATMTLPGIAGLILTMGMAVDANVLIFERIREELALGKRIKTAISAGYEKVFTTIIDANLTTLITSVILYYFGRGPIKGFAVVLMTGIIASMFTSLFVTKTLFQFLLEAKWLNTLKMFCLVPKTQYKFINKRKVAYVFSLIVILAALFGFFGKGSKKYGIDFQGGAVLQLTFQEEVKIEDLRQSLVNVGKDISLQYFGSRKDILIRAKMGQNEDIKKQLNKADFPSFDIAREEEVGPVVGKELKKSSVLAICFSLLGIICYIAFRFDGKYSVAAICALIHDVAITAGLYCLLGYEINVPTIAALLTIVGYSLNDTIVIFDRIRETLRKNIKKTRMDLINEAINSTLGRTLLTSVTTLMVVVSIMLYGGGIIHDFAVTLFIGVIVGTYSSIFVAAPLLVEFQHN